MTRWCSGTTAIWRMGLGNLASRTAAMIEKNCGGKIPKPGSLQAQDTALAKEAQTAIGEVMEHYEKLEFSRGLEAIWSLISAADKYLTVEKPWSLGESGDEQQRRATVLWTTAEVLRVVTVLTHPVLPESTAKVWVAARTVGSAWGSGFGRIGVGATRAGHYAW